MKVIVIGAGASGLMSAYICAKCGHDVTIIEKNEKVGKKLYITGKGRCNVTNYCNSSKFLENVVNNALFLYSSISYFKPQDTIDFLEEFNVKTKVERGNRVFPESDKASDVIKALKKACDKYNVVINLNETVIDAYKEQNVFIVKTSKKTYRCDILIICTGGKSYSSTGSDGFGYELARKFGHNIVCPVPALCPIKLKDKWVKQLQGLSLKNVELYAYSDKKLILKEFGELLFTADGISGPIVLTTSSYINRKNNIELFLDLKPALTEDTLEKRLLRDFDLNKNKELKTVMKGLLPVSLIEIFLFQCQINGNVKINSIKISQRKKIVNVLKHFQLNFDRLYDLDYAIITSGGVNVKEVNPKTMESKLVKNLYFAGEILDVDALTGGFNIQIAFSTANSIIKGVLNNGNSH